MLSLHPECARARSKRTTSTAPRRRRVSARLGVVCAGIAAASLAVPATSGDASSLNHELAKLRHCESGGRWHINTHNGYYGAYQFSESTWKGLGFHGYPNRAKPDTQSEAALKLHSRRGWRPWPSCARKEHLR